jgi:hypothetical protein
VAPPSYFSSTVKGFSVEPFFRMSVVHVPQNADSQRMSDAASRTHGSSMVLGNDARPLVMA